MSRVWSDRQLSRVTPPQANDVRGTAFLGAINRYLGEHTLPGPQVRDPETCPADVLPALIAEYSMEEFIEPGLPEHVVRRILKNRWMLQSLEGKDAGVKLGLTLLGMTAVIDQWWQATPMRQPNTHVLTFHLGEQLFEPNGVIFGEREQNAALKMISAMKRHSQGSEIRIGLAMETRALTAQAGTAGVRFRGIAKAMRPAIHSITRAGVRSGMTTAIRFCGNGISDNGVTEVKYGIEH